MASCGAPGRPVHPRGQLVELWLTAPDYGTRETPLSDCLRAQARREGIEIDGDHALALRPGVARFKRGAPEPEGELPVGIAGLTKPRRVSPLHPMSAVVNQHSDPSVLTRASDRCEESSGARLSLPTDVEGREVR